MALLVVAVFAYAQESQPIIASVRIEGASAISEPDLRAALGWREGSAFNTNEIEPALERALNLYRDAGYLFAEADALDVAESNGAVALTLRIREGGPATLEDVIFVGLSALSEDAARSALRVKTRRRMNGEKLREGVRRLIRRYAEKGRPHATVTAEIADDDPREGSVVMRLTVDEGPLTVIERIEFEGLEKTRESAAARLLTIRAGDVYDQRKIDASRHALLNSGYFASIHPSDIQRGSDDGRIVFRARVEEANTARIAGLLGYAPPETETDSPQLTGLIEAAERNLFGTGREVEFRWESGENRTTRVAYREPYLFGRALSLDLQWDAERFEDARRQVAQVGVSWRLMSYARLRIGGQAIDADDRSGVGGLAGFEIDTRDFRANPSRGWLFRATSDFLSGDVSLRRVEATLWRFQPLRPRHVLAARLQAGKLFGVDIPLTEWYFLGGAATLRGYREREFRGTQRSLGGVEYRLLTGPQSHVFAFFDVGQVSDGAVRFGPKVGYGFGANLESRGGLVRLQYGVAPGTSPLDGKVHIRLGTVF